MFRWTGGNTMVICRELPSTHHNWIRRIQNELIFHLYKYSEPHGIIFHRTSLSFSISTFLILLKYEGSGAFFDVELPPII